MDDFPVLDVETADFIKRATGIGGELCDDGEGTRGVDRHLASVELLVSNAVGIVGAAAFVADSRGAALRPGALVKARLGTSMGCYVGRLGIGFPDIELIAA